MLKKKYYGFQVCPWREDQDHKTENSFQVKVGKQKCQILKSCATSYIMTKIRRVMQADIEQSERKSKCFPTSSYCILAGVHWLDRTHDSTALQFPQGSCMVPDMLHKLIPNQGETDCVLLQRGFPHRAVPLKPRSPGILKGLDTYKPLSPQKTHSSFLSAYALSACNVTSLQMLTDFYLFSK